MFANQTINGTTARLALREQWKYCYSNRESPDEFSWKSSETFASQAQRTTPFKTILFNLTFERKSWWMYKEWSLKNVKNTLTVRCYENRRQGFNLNRDVSTYNTLSIHWLLAFWTKKSHHFVSFSKSLLLTWKV